MALLNEKVGSRLVEEVLLLGVWTSGHAALELSCSIRVRVIMDRVAGQLEGERVTHSNQDTAIYNPQLKAVTSKNTD
jgi:hypothetical protein